MFKGANHSLLVEEVENLELNKQELRYFNECFFLYPDENKYLLREGVTEIEEEWCFLNILKCTELHVTDEDKKKLANILEKVEGLKRENSFIANIYANPTHPYFFEHPLDHVPGLLILEACRQVGTAGFHIYGKVPIQEVEMMLAELNAKFHNYLEINSPIDVAIFAEHVKQHKKGYWSSASMKAFVFQNGYKIAEVKVVGNGIDKKTLNRIRSRHK
jgi:hypothetical protein